MIIELKDRKPLNPERGDMFSLGLSRIITALRAYPTSPSCSHTRFWVLMLTNTVRVPETPTELINEFRDR